jgi:hypothetical protein
MYPGKLVDKLAYSPCTFNTAATGPVDGDCCCNYPFNRDDLSRDYNSLLHMPGE